MDFLICMKLNWTKKILQIASKRVNFYSTKSRTWTTVFFNYVLDIKFVYLTELSHYLILKYNFDKMSNLNSTYHPKSPSTNSKKQHFFFNSKKLEHKKFKYVWKSLCIHKKWVFFWKRKFLWFLKWFKIRLWGETKKFLKGTLCINIKKRRTKRNYLRIYLGVLKVMGLF